MNKAEFLKQSIIKNGWSKKEACQVLDISDELFETYLSDPYLHDNIVFEICSKLDLYPISEVKFSISEECLEYLKQLQKLYWDLVESLDKVVNNDGIEKQNMDTAHTKAFNDQAAAHYKRILSYSEQIKHLQAQLREKDKYIVENKNTIEDNTLNGKLNSTEYCCRVCGYQSENPIWFDEKNPSKDNCVCCGVKFGFEDTSQSEIFAYRDNWIKNGAKWYHTMHHSFRSEKWDLELQFLQIPNKWK